MSRVGLMTSAFAIVAGIPRRVDEVKPHLQHGLRLPAAGWPVSSLITQE